VDEEYVQQKEIKRHYEESFRSEALSLKSRLLKKHSNVKDGSRGVSLDNQTCLVVKCKSSKKLKSPYVFDGLASFGSILDRYRSRWCRIK
jgi:hypothetical protein